MRHKLRAVADTQHGDTQLKELLIDSGRALAVNALRAACKDYALGRKLFYFVDGYLAVNITFAHAASDKLVILTAEVDYKHIFVTLLPHFNNQSFQNRQKRADKNT